MAVYVYNTSKHSALRMRPYKALYGYNVRNVTLEFYRPEFESTADERIGKLRKVHAWVMSRMKETQDERNTRRNQEKTLPEFFPGQLVKFQRQVRNKLQNCWSGPVKVIRKISPVDYLLDLSDYSGRLYPVIHVCYLKPWNRYDGNNEEQSDETLQNQEEKIKASEAKEN